MKRSRLLKPQSPQSICILCAFRRDFAAASGAIYRPLEARRFIQSSRSKNAVAAAASAPQEQDESHGPSNIPSYSQGAQWPQAGRSPAGRFCPGQNFGTPPKLDGNSWRSTFDAAEATSEDQEKQRLRARLNSAPAAQTTTEFGNTEMRDKSINDWRSYRSIVGEGGQKREQASRTHRNFAPQIQHTTSFKGPQMQEPNNWDRRPDRSSTSREAQENLAFKWRPHIAREMNPLSETRATAPQQATSNIRYTGGGSERVLTEEEKQKQTLREKLLSQVQVATDVRNRASYRQLGLRNKRPEGVPPVVKRYGLSGRSGEGDIKHGERTHMMPTFLQPENASFRKQYNVHLHGHRPMPNEATFDPNLTSHWKHLAPSGRQAETVSAAETTAPIENPPTEDVTRGFGSQYLVDPTKPFENDFQSFVGAYPRQRPPSVQGTARKADPSVARLSPRAAAPTSKIENAASVIEQDLADQPLEIQNEYRMQKTRAKKTEKELDEDRANGMNTREEQTPLRLKSKKFAQESKHEEIAEKKLKSNKREKGGRQAHRELDDEEDYWELDEEDQSRIQRARDRKRQKAARKAAKEAAAPATPISLPEYMSVSYLAGALKVRLPQFISKLEELGFQRANHDHILNSENAALVAMEYNFEPTFDTSETIDLEARPPAPDQSVLPQRPPVVTIMGHVDHGKTTLLDFLRKSSVAASEHGGITQHIGAFSVTMSSGKLITFLDTPGHAAFLSMRQRGANVTDIVVLVVAADDSVKPQTLEALKHAKAAKVPIIVAINKIDKDQANVERVKQDLARYSIDIEDFGGDTQVVCVSGKTGQGMEELEETVITLSEILDIRGETDGPVEGWIIEASTKKAGRVATVLVKRGTLHPGDVIVAGTKWARVRKLRNEAGVEQAFAGPGTPVEVDGWRGQPMAGDEVLQAPTEQKAVSVVAHREVQVDRKALAVDMEAINEARKAEQERREKVEQTAAAATGGDEPALVEKSDEEASTGPLEINIIVKADASGSAEAVCATVLSLAHPEVVPRILRSGVGPVSEFDIEHAASAGGYIANFNLPVPPAMSQFAEEKGVKIIDENIIYRLADEVKAIMSERLAPLVTKRVLGEAEIAQVFDINYKGRKTMPVAGCKVRNGTISRNTKVRVVRVKDTVFDGMLATLKNVKKDITEMRKGAECGMSFEGWSDFAVGDQIQCYEEKVEKRSL